MAAPFVIFAALAALVLMPSPPTLAQTVREEERLLSLGEHLSGECSTCHKAGSSKGIPVITGQAPERFVAALMEYRDGRRANPVMASVARSLNEIEMRALAAYFQAAEGKTGGLSDAPDARRHPRAHQRVH
jgi:cytochrome c553